MAHTLTVQIDSSALEKLLEKQLKNLRAAMKRRLNKAMKRLMTEVALPEAHRWFGNAVTLTVEKASDGYVLKAQGDAVCFLEFGAGVAADDDDIFAAEVPFAIEPGSWSSSVFGSGEFAKYGSWHFGGVKYTQITPVKGMHNAYNKICREAQRIVNEEMSK